MSWPSNSSRTKNWGTEILTDSDFEGQIDLLHNYLNDSLNGTSGHGHTGGTNDGKKIDLTTAVTGLLPNANLATINTAGVVSGAALTLLSSTPSGAGALPLANSTTQSQIQQTVKTDTFSMTGTTYTDITGLSVTITPKATTSKILVRYIINASEDSATSNIMFQLLNGSTPIGNGAAAGSRTVGNSAIRCGAGGSNIQAIGTGEYLDSPATTSAVTYKVQMLVSNGSTAYVNRSSDDTNSGSGVYPRLSSTITAIEFIA